MSDRRTRTASAIREFRFNSVYVRDFIVAMVLVLLPLLGLNIFLFRASERMVVEEASILSSQGLRNTRDVVDSIFRDVDYLAASMSLDSDTQLYAISPDLSPLLGQTGVRSISSRLRFAVYSNAYVHSFYVYSEPRNRVITRIGENDFQTFVDRSWVPAYESIREDQIQRELRRVGDIYPYVISVIKPLYLFDQEVKYGAVIVNVAVDALRSVLSDPDPNSPELLYLFDQEGTVLFSADRAELGLNRSDLDLESIISETESVVNSERSAYYPWEYVSIHALDSYVLRSTRLRGIMVLILVLSLIATVVAAILIAGNAYRPIRRIIQVIENPDGPKSLDDSTPANETRYIAGAIARFTQANGELRDELHRQLDLIDEARINALQIQINPHFLNNTLEAMSMSARRLTSGPNDVTQMVTLLSRLLLTALDTSEQVVPFAEEIDHTNIYLGILMLRYKNRIRVEWDIPEAVEKLGALKLSLQPLVENAFYHGIKPTRGEGTVRIESRVRDGEVVTTVSNTGQPIAGSTLARIRKSLTTGYNLSSEHIGLHNVHQRLRLLFGDSYGLQVSSGGKEYSTSITITTPVITDPVQKQVGGREVEQ